MARPCAPDGEVHRSPFVPTTPRPSTGRVYRIVRVLSGDATEEQEILVPTGYDLDGDTRILVGRLVTQQQVGWAEHMGPDKDPSLLVLHPRSPPQ